MPGKAPVRDHMVLVSFIRSDEHQDTPKESSWHFLIRVEHDTFASTNFAEMSAAEGFKFLLRDDIDAMQEAENAAGFEHIRRSAYLFYRICEALQLQDGPAPELGTMKFYLDTLGYDDMVAHMNDDD